MAEPEKLLGWPLRLFHDSDTIRLVSTAYIDEPALLPLVDDESDLDILADIEERTSRRFDRDMPLPVGLQRRELVTSAHGPCWTHINAAFSYTRPSGNRFNDRHRGAWYATFGDEAATTALTEVAFHLTRELDNTGLYENTTDYQELHAGFSTPMVDLREARGAHFLDPDAAIGYPAGQALARDLLHAGGNGVLYPSARHRGGWCLAAFRPTHVQNVRPGARWRLEWAGRREPSIVEARP